MPTPDWAQCHVEIYEVPGWLDDCFRSSLWTLFQAAASQSFEPGSDITGDLAPMSVTEGATPTGCGYRKDISGEGLSTDTYPIVRARLRGSGTSPQYRLSVEYTDASETDSGWIDVQYNPFTVKTMQLTSGKTVKYVKLYARSNSAGGSATIGWDYVAILRNPPMIPEEVEEVEVDLQTTTAVGGLRLKLLNDLLLGVTARRYSLDEGFGTKAYDLSRNKGHAGVVNATWNTSGRHGGCLYFLASSSCRLDTGYKTTIPATGALTITFWVKASSGVTGVICGLGRNVGADWNRVQLNWSSDKVRLYVKDDSANVRQYTSAKTVADNQWHLIVGIINPATDKIELYIDNVYDGGASGTLGQITLDLYDLTWGCLHNAGGYTNHTTCYVDEPTILTRALDEREVYDLFIRDPPSGAARAGPGAIAMVYLAAHDENQVYKIITARIIDRVAGGEPDNPTLEVVGEDLGEILLERTFTEEYAVATQISGIVDDIMDQLQTSLFHQIDTTNRSIKNRFRDEGAWSLLQKLAETAKYATGESGANFYVDPGGALRFKKYGAFNCPHALSDGSDGNPANLLDIKVRETMKGEPRLVNDVKVIIFEEEAHPRDEDALTESVEGWSSPDPTDSGYPQSDTGDVKSGTASIHFNTTNPGTQYRMRLELTDLDITGFDQIKFWMKYGSGLNIDSFEVRIWRGGWLWVTDYLEKTGITPKGSATWHEYTVDIPDMAKTGNPGSIIKNLRIRAVHSTEIGTGGFLIDKLRFVRAEKYGSAGDAASQQNHGKRTLREVDKTITDLDYAGYVAENIVEHRKTPLILVQATVPGRGQPGYRPPQMVTVTSLKDGLDGASFQIVRTRHRYTPGDGYTCDLDLVAARKPDGTYEPKVAPVVVDLGAVLAEMRRRRMQDLLNSLRTEWE